MKDKLLAILIPTRCRSESLVDCLKDLKARVEYRPLMVYVVFDGDWEGYERFDQRIFSNEFPGKIYVLKEQREYIGAVNYAAAAAYGDGAEYILPWSDDSYLLGPTPLQRAIVAHRARFGLGMGVLAMNNPYWGDKLGTHALLNRGMVEHLDYGNGAIFNPAYVHYGGDNELTARAKKEYAFAFCPDVHVKHPTPLETQGNPSMIHKSQDGATWLRREKEINGG